MDLIIKPASKVFEKLIDTRTDTGEISSGSFFKILGGILRRMAARILGRDGAK